MAITNPRGRMASGVELAHGRNLEREESLQHADVEMASPSIALSGVERSIDREGSQYPSSDVT